MGLLYYIWLWTAWLQTQAFTPLSEAQAREVQSYLQTQSHIVWYCQEEDSDFAKKIQLQEVQYRYQSQKKSYEILLSGYVEGHYQVEQGRIKHWKPDRVALPLQVIDLAEIFVPVRSQDNFYKVRSYLWDVVALCKILDIEAYPCTEDFEYPFLEP
jgi:hypothetical protein